MNLWVRTLRQLAVLAVALFFFSCEDESGLLGFRNPNKKFHVGYVDIPLNASSVLVYDSVVTDLRPIFDPQTQRTLSVDGVLVGQYQDPLVGTISARSFLSVYPTSNTALPTTAVFDSVTVQFRLNFHAYGFTGESTQRFGVHEITGDTLTLYNGNRYYASSTPPAYSAEPLGEAAITVRYDSLIKEGSSSSPDTLLATGRLDDAYGARIFDAIKAGFETQAQHRLFRSQIKGLALLPGAEPGILGMNLVSSGFGQFSRVIIHYHTLTDGGAVADTLARSLGFEFSSFTQVEADRSGTELASLIPYQSADPGSDNRYVQSIPGVATKLDLTPFYQFADTVGNALINSAELVIDGVTGGDGTPPHRSLQLRLLKNDSDQFLNSSVSADREIAQNYRVEGSLAHKYYSVAPDLVGTALTYDDEDNGYSGFVTLFVQSLFGGRDQEDRLAAVALVPDMPMTVRQVTRTVFSKENVKLRIYYTRARGIAN